jgi:hypothetical protein
MDYTTEDSQNAAPNQATMAEQAKLNGSAAAASTTQSVTKRLDTIDSIIR